LAPGYRVAAVQLEPRIVRVNAADDVLEGITEVALEPMDVAGATDDVTRTVQVRSISNAIITPEQVEVRVVIEPITCDEIDDEESCATSAVIVQPQFGAVPAGLALGPGIYQVRVDLLGTPEDLAALELSDVVASIPLAGLEAGTHTLTAEVAVPEGITVTSVRSITITLAAVP
jgi:YbbR domain-containing protein